MVAKWPMELKEALIIVKHEQVKTEDAIVRANLFLEEARIRWGMQAKPPTGGTAALYHLLRPGTGQAS